MRYRQLQNEIDDLKKRMALIHNAIQQKESEQEKIKADILNEFLTTGLYPEKPFEIRSVPPKPIVIDESKIPDKFFRTKRELDKKLVNECFKNGEQIEGVTLDNGGYTVAFKSMAGS